MDEIAIPLSGDPEQDQKNYEDAVLHYRRIQEGLCPNGCGAMVRTSEFAASCPLCHFQWSTNDVESLELLDRSF